MKYTTTRPIIPPSSDRSVIRTQSRTGLKIELRNVVATDLEHVHNIRTQQEVMIKTSQGTVDKDIEASKVWLERWLPPNDKFSYNTSIWVSEGNDQWEHVGFLGALKVEIMPYIGYMIRSQWWGRGIVSTALQAFVDTWWSLEREAVTLDTDLLDEPGKPSIRCLEASSTTMMLDNALDSELEDSFTGAIVPEMLVAEVEPNNPASVKILTGRGFVHRGHRQYDEGGAKDREVLVHLYTMSRPSQSPILQF